MNRKTFIHHCGGICVSTSLLMTFAESCATQKPVIATLDNNRLVVPLQSFYIEKEGQRRFKRSVVIRHEKTIFPVVVFRRKENDYQALLLRCTHQGQELNLHGDLISCSAHGSEFSNRGDVIQGPAETPLQSFPVHADSENIYITLL